MNENMSLDLANFLQNAVKNNDNNGIGGNNGFLWIFLLLLFGYGNGGLFSNRGQGTVGTAINDAAITGVIDTAIAKAQAAGVSDQLMLQAVNGNKEAIERISAAMNCDRNSVTSALNTINSGVDKLAGQIGLTSQQVVNAIQAGNADLTSRMQSCCCEVKNAITTSNYENQLQIINQTNALSSQMQQQTTILGAKIDAQTQIINDKFCQLEMREQARIIDRQGNEISDLKNRLSTQEVLAAIAAKSTTTTTT